MLEKKIKNYSSLIKLAALVVFAAVIFFTILKKPEVPEEISEKIREIELITYGGKYSESGWNVIKSGRGGYIIAASSSSFGAGKSDGYLIKTDKNGSLEWTRTFGGEEKDNCVDVENAHGGGYILAGGTESFGYGETDVYVVKTGEEGHVEWEATYGGHDHDQAYSICAATNNSYVIAGYSSSFNELNSDCYLIRIKSDGSVLWEKTYGNYGWDVLYSVKQTKDGGFIAAGYTNSYGEGLSDMYVIKTDSNGNTKWAGTYGGKREDRAVSVEESPSGGYFISGKTTSYNSRGFGWDIIYMEIDSRGNSLWSRVIPAADLEVGANIRTDGKYLYMTGTKKCYGICKSDIYLMKAGLKGDIIWERTFSGKSNDMGNSLILDNGPVIAGTTLSFGHGNGDVFLTKISETGEQEW